MVAAYRLENNINEVILPPPSEPQPDIAKPKTKESSTKNTREITFELFEKGLTIPEIAKERSLVTSTIESHMASQVSAGRVKIEKLLPAEKIALIEQKINRMKNHSFKEIKHALGNNCSYGEILLVQAHMNQGKG